MRFFEIFFVPLQPKGCETAPARPLDLWSLATEETQESMQASLLSLRSALPLGLSKNRSFGPRNFT